MDSNYPVENSIKYSSSEDSGMKNLVKPISRQDENRNNFADLFLRPSWIRDPISPLILPISRKISSKNLNSLYDELPEL
jgi:hypothetical protein